MLGVCNVAQIGAWITDIIITLTEEGQRGQQQQDII